MIHSAPAPPAGRRPRTRARPSLNTPAASSSTLLPPPSDRAEDAALDPVHRPPPKRVRFDVASPLLSDAVGTPLSDAPTLPPHPTCPPSVAASPAAPTRVSLVAPAPLAPSDPRPPLAARPGASSPPSNDAVGAAHFAAVAQAVLDLDTNSTPPSSPPPGASTPPSFDARRDGESGRQYEERLRQTTLASASSDPSAEPTTLPCVDFREGETAEEFEERLRREVAECNLPTVATAPVSFDSRPTGETGKQYERRLRKQTMEDALNNLSEATKKVYTGIEVKFNAWAVKFYAGEPDVHIVYENKVHAYLVEEASRVTTAKPRSKNTGPAHDPAPVSHLAASTMGRYVSALVWVYNKQREAGINPHGHPRGTLIDKFLKNYTSTEHQRALDTDCDAVTSTRQAYVSDTLD